MHSIVCCVFWVTVTAVLALAYAAGIMTIDLLLSLCQAMFPLFSQPSNSDQEGYLHVFPQWVPWLQALSFRFLPSSSVRRVYMASSWARHALETQVAGLGFRLGIKAWPDLAKVCMYSCWYVCMHKPGACMPHDRDNKQIPIHKPRTT